MTSILRAVQRRTIGTMIAVLCCASFPALAQSADETVPPTAPLILPNPAPVQAQAMKAACIKPVYPRASILAGEQGTVNASFLIGIDGRVKDQKIIKSSGFVNLDNAVLDALSKCSFRPVDKNGTPQESWHDVKYVWSMS